MEDVFEKLALHRVVPVIAIDSVDDALPLADALTRGGLPIAEITCRTQAAAQAIELIRRHRPEVLVGAGTVLTAAQVAEVSQAGAQFAVAPGYNPSVVGAALHASLPFAPGVMTPTDIEAALQMGIRVLKFFPAGAAGGPAMLRAISAPYAHTGIRFMPTGGVSADNLASYLALPGVLACGGTWIARQADIAAGKWDVIEETCREAVKTAGRV